VRVGLAASGLEQCVAFDADFDGAVAIAELIQGVDNSLAGCAASEAQS
jgi:hypothetical protein